MSYYLQIICNPLLLWELLHQIKFNFYRILFLSKSDTFGYPFNMGVNYYTWLIIDIAPYYIGSLSSNSGQTYQILNIPWNFTIIFCSKSMCTSNYILCFVSIKPG